MTASGFKYLSVFILICATSVASAGPNCRRDRFLYQEAQRLYQSNQMLLSALHFSELRTSECDAEIASHSWLGYSLAVSHLQENSEAIQAIEEGITDPRVASRDRESLRMLETWIQQRPARDLTSTQKIRWNLWSERLDRSEFLKSLEHAEIKDSDKQTLSELQQRFLTAPKKNVWVSGIASAIVPGAGQAYVGNWQSAAIAFVINAVVLAAALEFSRKDMPSAALAMSGVFSITYIGNIVSAAQSANEANNLARSEQESQLKSDLLPELTF